MPDNSQSGDSGLIKAPTWNAPENRAIQQMAEKPDGTEMIVGGKPQIDSEDVVLHSFKATQEQKAFSDPNFTACEKSSGDGGIAACDRAIASGKFSGRMLSYLYSDRSFMRMQKGELESALADLNEAARIDSTNFYAFWNRGAVYAAKGDFARAQADFTAALALNPDETSKAQIEEALNVVVAAAKAPHTDTPIPSVITDPSRFWGQDQEGSASASSSYPAKALPAAPAEAFPAAPSMETTPMPAEPPPPQ